MKTPRKEDIPHKIALYSLLSRLLSNPIIANSIYFKGGTCASMLGFLDRFSVDLDFDLIDKSKKALLREEIHKEINKLHYSVKDESPEHLQFFLKYRDVENERNTLKLEITDLVAKHNVYKKFYLNEIGMYCQAQTIETMFANKLVALKARWEEGKGISGRDLYDIHHFFKKDYGINDAIIEDLRSKQVADYFAELIVFIEKYVTEKMLFEDLNPILSQPVLRETVSLIKPEVLIALRSYIID